MAFQGFGFGVSQPAATPSLFGSAPAAPLFGAAPTSAPSLFGAPAASATPSLFGQQPTAAQAPASTFSFGAPAATSAPPLGGSLFGAPATAPLGGGLFGGGASAGGGLFGASAAPSTGGSLFGGLNSSAPKLGGLFGAPTAGTSLLGQQQQPQASTSLLTPQAPAGPPISKRTKFNDLPDAARNTIESIDTFIRSQIQISDDLKSRDLGIDITKTSELYEQYSIESTTVLNMLSQDARQVAELRHRLENDQSDLAKITALIEGYKNPQVKGAAAKAVANFPFEYFSRKAEEFKERLSRYKSTMDQIQQQLSSSHSFSQNPAAILPSLRAQHTSFMSLASSVASLDHDLRTLKDEYRSIWRAKTGSVQDPFSIASGKGRRDIENGVAGIAIR